MISENITNVKGFMSRLLIGTEFDTFLATDVSITTYNTFTIDGHVQKDFFTKEEIDNNTIPNISEWSTLKPLCYQIIKGTKTPLRFKIIFQIPDNVINSIIEHNSLDVSPDSITGAFLNIKYENNTLTYVTGTSLSMFDFNKTFEKAFDKYISNFVSTLFD